MNRRINTLDLIKFIVVGIFAIITVIFPLWIIIINSMKNLRESEQLGIGFPSEWQFIQNYKHVIIQGRFLVGFFNSLLVTGVSIFIIILFASLAAWVYARSKSKVISFFYYLSVAAVLIPPAIVTSIRVLKFFHIYGNSFGLIVFYIGIFMSFALFLITGFIKTIPIELEEVARIDGCSTLRIFFNIIFPLIRPIILTASVILTLGIWNDFFYPFFILSKSYQWTLPMGLYNFISYFMFQLNWNYIFADVILVSLPLVIVYYFAQKHILAGIMSGAIKG